MCQHCVIEQVKEQMLSRRSLFRSATAVAAAATVGSIAAPARAQATAQTLAVAVSPSGVRDLTHELHPDFPTFFGEQHLKIVPKLSFAKDGLNLNEWVINEHTGTHIDSPLHFSAAGQSIAEVPLENFVVPLAIIDIREKAAANPDAQVTPDDIKAWISKNGPIPDSACVAMNSGWDAYVTGPKFRNVDDKKALHFPGFHVEAVNMLLESTSASGIASDTLSLDFGISPDFATHKAWLPRGKWGIEAIANLGHLPAKGAMLVVGAPKIRGATGGPSRIFAFV